MFIRRFKTLQVFRIEKFYHTLPVGFFLTGMCLDYILLFTGHIYGFSGKKYFKFYSEVKSIQIFVVDAFICTLKHPAFFMFLFHSGQLGDCRRKEQKQQHPLKAE